MSQHNETRGAVGRTRASGFVCSAADSLKSTSRHLDVQVLWIMRRAPLSPELASAIAETRLREVPMSALPAPLAGKLGLLIPRLASEHDGEVIATVRAIRRTLAAQRLDLHDFARSLLVTQPEPARVAPASDFEWRAMVEFCLSSLGSLNHRQAEFVRSMGCWSGAPTDKQRAWLRAIYAKLRRRS